MCVVLVAYRVFDAFPLIILSNRDEYHDRPSRLIAPWNEDQHIFAGRDLLKDGTWLGVNRSRGWGVITNVRDGSLPKIGFKKSRGELVHSFLDHSDDIPSFLYQRKNSFKDYDKFNLLIGDAEAAYFASNQTNEIRKVSPGIHLLSNASLNTPWPKTERLKALFGEKTVSQSGKLVFDLISILNDQERALDEFLPDTGIGLQLERELSSIFVSRDGYGTVQSTVVVGHANGEMECLQRSYFENSAQNETYLRLLT